MNLKDIFRIPYGYVENTLFKSKKVNIFDELIKTLQKILEDFDKKFSTEIENLKKENEALNKKIEEIIINKADKQNGTYTYKK